MISKVNSVDLEAKDILMIFEVKMSIVSNWQYFPVENRLECLGDFTTHKGTPGLLRSDSMLKAIGKSIDIRVSSENAMSIPIIILGNTPITKNYIEKVDKLYTKGIIQGFWSVNPTPTSDSNKNLKESNKGGFYRFDSFDKLKSRTNDLLDKELNAFSAAKGKCELGKIIEQANKKTSYEEKAEEFLKLIGE